MTASERAARTHEADQLCAQAYEGTGCPETGVALVAVGGYGRGELAPYSDLDLVLVHDDGLEMGEWAGGLWYPLWDTGQAIDHSVRSVAQVLELASADLRVAMGTLDVRHLAGDPNLTLRLRTAVLTQWRRDARTRLRELHELVDDRGRRAGELAHASVPDLKESVGGLRDASVLKALVASWLVDVPTEALRLRRGLLDVRDVLHEVAGRRTDRVLPEYWGDLAGGLGLPDAEAAQRHTRSLARRVTHLSRLTWRRAEAVQRRPSTVGPRRPRLDPIPPGLAVSYEEVVLASRARADRDPKLLLRAAAEAAERDLVLAPSTAARLTRDAPDLGDPWPVGARDLFVRLLAAGPGLLGVWETLDETGALTRILPEWERIRLLPHASVVHRFTVDRHVVETCIEAAPLLGRVSRPDVLMVACLLHDIGKGGLIEHCAAGEPLARRIAARMGFDSRETDLIGDLVRWHLLLAETASTRDPDDPATIETVTSRVRDREALGLLGVLTEADARATSEKAWTSWRAGLVRTLVRRAAAGLDDRPPEDTVPAPLPVPAELLSDPTRAVVRVREEDDRSSVTVVSGDRVGLLGDVAAAFAVQRLSVRSARAWTEERDGAAFGVSVWEVAETGLDAAVLRQRLEAVRAGRVDPLARRQPAGQRREPVVVVRPEASARATVLEVRSVDRPGVALEVCRALADMGISVRSAHLSTLGPQALEVFYVQEEAAGALSEERAAEAAHALRAALDHRSPDVGQ